MLNITKMKNDDVEVSNYMAIDLLENLGIENPTQKQIDKAESFVINILNFKN